MDRWVGEEGLDEVVEGIFTAEDSIIIHKN
jgi:hypothetical protein